MSQLPPQFYVTGTDTGLGKTVVSALLCRVLGAAYWKPVQAGLDEETDTARVARLSGAKVYPEAYALRRPASPHAAADDEGLVLDLGGIRLPTAEPLVVEGAGGLMVPYVSSPLRWQHELIQQLGLATIVVARTGLGTLNHSFLTLSGLKQLGIECIGLVLVGEPHPENERDLSRYSGSPVLARIDWRADPEADFEALAKQLKTDLEQRR